MRYVFFVNPTAGKGKKQDGIISAINDYFSKNGGNFKIVVTEYKSQAESLAREEAETGDELRIFACGGEGTGYEVINGIVGYDNVSYGIIPCGSANDFVRGIGSAEYFLDISRQIEGDTVPVDLIKAGERYCINGCSVGMDAMVARDMGLFKNLPFVSGTMAYTLAIIKTFLKKLGVRIKLKVDEADLGEVDCLFAVIANGPYYGGGYMGAPDAVPFDGKLDFTKVDVINKLSVLRFIGKYKKGSHGNLSCCSLRNCEEMYFEAEKPLPVNLDGEIIVANKMYFSLVKKGLNFIIPKGVSCNYIQHKEFEGSTV